MHAWSSASKQYVECDHFVDTDIVTSYDAVGRNGRLDREDPWPSSDSGRGVQVSPELTTGTAPRIIVSLTSTCTARCLCCCQNCLILNKDDNINNSVVVQRMKT